MDKDQLDKAIATAEAYMVAWRVEYERLLALRKQAGSGEEPLPV